MQGTRFSHAIRNTIMLLSMSALLSGCLMGEEEPQSDEELLSDNQLSGSVGDGPVVGAAMRVLTSDGQPLAEFESDATAGYNVTVRTKGKHYPLSIDARNGIDLVTNSAPDFVLLGAALEPGKKTVANVSPFSTFSVEMARDLPGGITKTNLVDAESKITEALNFGLVTLMATGANSTLIDASNVAEIVKASEALGETVRRTRDLQLMFNRPSSGDTVVQAMASDLVDGVMDGAGGPRVNARISAISTVVAVQVLLEAMQNELHVNGTNATDRLSAAIGQVAGADIGTNLADLTVTPQMLDATRVGLDACIAVIDDAKLTALRDAVAGMQGGMEPTFIQPLIPNDYRATLDNALQIIAGGDDTMIATVNDVAGGGSATDPAPVNNAPTISGSPATSVAEGTAYAFTPTASDPDGDTLTFSISGQPAWTSFDTATGTLTGTPAVGDAGTYSNIVIGVSDGALTDSLAAFSITVTAAAPVNNAPTISGSPATSVAEGTAYAFTPTASDPDGDTLTFSISGQPAWTSFDTVTGTLTGTPAVGDAGTYGNIVIGVSDGALTDSLAAFSITVTEAAPVNNAPTISGSPATEVNANTAYSFTPSANDADGDALTFAITGQPVWASFDTTTGQLSGTPTDADVGTYSNILISVSDGELTDELSAFTITVNAVSLGSVTLSWAPPTENEDGTALTDLAGYRIYWGTTPGTYTESVTLDNPGLTSYVVENLAPGTYEFVATSYNTSGVESVYSNPATKTVQ